MEERDAEGSSESRESAPGPATPAGAFVGLALCLAVVGFATWEPMPAGVWHDDGVYVLLGRALADGDGLRYVGVSGSPPATKFPPLYPSLLAGVFTAAPGFPENVRVAAALNLVLMSVAGALFAVLCHTALALPVSVSLFAAAVAWTSTDLWRVAAIPLSEPLFLALLAVSLTWGARAERTGSLRDWLLFAIGFALTFHARTVGAAVAAAATLSSASQRQWGRALGIAAGAAVIMSPWLLWSRVRSFEIAEPLRDILGSYGGFLVTRVAPDPWAFARGLPADLWRLGDWTLAMILPGAPPAVRGALAGPALLLGLLGARELWKRSRLVALTVAMLMAALWMWPFLDRRLLAPMVPWLVLLPVVGALAWMRPGDSAEQALRVPVSVAQWKSPRAWPAAAVLAWSLWFAGTSVLGLFDGRHEAGYLVRAPALESAVQAVTRTTEAAAVVGAPELWAALHLYTGRTVAPSAPFRPGAAPPWGSPADQLELWQAAGLDYVLVEHGGRVHGAALDRIDERCPDGSVVVVARYEGAALVRLAWDASCKAAVAPGG